MMLEPKWPFRSREHALAHERAYLAGSYAPPRSRRVQLVERIDLELEHWLENGGAARLREAQDDAEAVRKIWLWKMRATIEAAGGCADPPAGILSPLFAQSLACALNAAPSEMPRAIEALTAFDGIAVRAASAFLFWLRPSEYQVIDRRATAALDLPFGDDDYTVENYLQYCELSRSLGAQHHLSLRQVDRALFTFQKLLDRPQPIIITI